MLIGRREIEFAKVYQSMFEKLNHLKNLYAYKKFFFQIISEVTIKDNINKNLCRFFFKLNFNISVHLPTKPS